MDYNDVLIEDCWDDYNFCMFNVKQDGYALQFVKEQTKELCLEAVKQDGLALYYVKEQTNEICLEAVKQNGYALNCVKEQTPELIHLMKKNNIRIVSEYLKVTQEQMDEYYEQNPHLLLTL